MLREEFNSAKRDYLYLLEKNYPQRGILKLVGDRHSLTGTERSMLYRGISTHQKCELRKSKRASVKEVRTNKITVDGYNVMITIGNYINGNTVFISNDGFLRDAAEMHGKVFRRELMEKVIELLLEDLRYLKVSSTMIFLDKPVSKSGELASKIGIKLLEHGLSGMAMTTDSPDYMLKQSIKGYIATSDSSIIDMSKLKTFDLARHVIGRKFRANLVDLR